ncbi:MAG: hypothetical protein PHN72_04055 [Bacilli bacterium]|nr:hypothetical protein [Bacilli bacterium]
MKLGKGKTKQLRKDVEEMLEEVPDNQQIYLDNKIIETLLFHTEYKSKNNDCSYEMTPVKYVMWSGPFLRKLDLSEISFDHVNWNVYYELLSEDNHYGEHHVENINLSGTNAYINFANAFRSKEGIQVSSCDFSHMNLSNSHFDMIDHVSESDFSYCNLHFEQNKAVPQTLFDSKFVGNDLSDFFVDLSFFVEDFKNTNPCYNRSALDCDFSDTGIRVIPTFLEMDRRIDNQRSIEQYNECLETGKLRNYTIISKEEVEKSYKKLKQKIYQSIQIQVKNNESRK